LQLTDPRSRVFIHPGKHIGYALLRNALAVDRRRPFRHAVSALRSAAALCRKARVHQVLEARRQSIAERRRRPSARRRITSPTLACNRHVTSGPHSAYQAPSPNGPISAAIRHANAFPRYPAVTVMRLANGHGTRTDQAPGRLQHSITPPGKTSIKRLAAPSRRRQPRRTRGPATPSSNGCLTSMLWWIHGWFR